MDIKEIALKVAEESGAVCYSPAPFLRAVRGYGLTYEQLQNFAEALISAYKAELLKEAREPVAWRADVATDFGIEDRYSGWETWLINYEPNCPLGSIRNKTGLFTSDQVAAAVLKATKPLEEEIDRLNKLPKELQDVRNIINASEVSDLGYEAFKELGKDNEQLRAQLVAAQEEIRSREDFIAMLQETQKDQLAKAEQRVAEACAELIHHHIFPSSMQLAIRSGEWRKFVKEV